jgi:hypothetical protein
MTTQHELSRDDRIVLDFLRSRGGIVLHRLHVGCVTRGRLERLGFIRAYGRWGSRITTEGAARLGS